MSESPEHRTLAQRALDLLVFAPAGFALTALEDLPAMAEKGRRQLSQHVRNAHIVGRFTVAQGKKRAAVQRDRFATPRAQTVRPDLRREPSASGEQAEGSHAPARSPSPENGVTLRRLPAPVPSRAPVPSAALNLAIPDYDTLSASQVVRRLDGLGPDELDAVRRHEAAGRMRRTILHRVDQLLAPAREEP